MTSGPDQFGPLVPSIEGDEDRSDGRRPQGHHHPLGLIREQRTNPVATSYTQREQAARDRSGLFE